MSFNSILSKLIYLQIILLSIFAGCSSGRSISLIGDISMDDDIKGESDIQQKALFPHLAAVPEDKERVLRRIDKEPFKTILNAIRQRAAQSPTAMEPGVWDVDKCGENAKIAQANAFLCWILDDSKAAQKGIEILKNIDTNFEDRQDRSDIDVNMPQVIQGYVNAYDFLLATPFVSRDESEIIANKITTLTDKFYSAFINDDYTRTVQLIYSQNNHNIRAASALGYAAIAFPEHPHSKLWRDWAFSELDFFWRRGNHYLLDEGGISEGPFYGMLAWQSSAILFIALKNSNTEPLFISRDCRTRIYTDPWQDYVCNEKERFKFENFLFNRDFQEVVNWYTSIRLPWGALPPLEDSMFKTYAGTAFMSSFDHSPIHWWAWKNNRDFPYLSDQSDDLSIYHLIYLDDNIMPAEPAFTNKFMPEAGQVVFRSDWTYDAIWLLLTAEQGDARKAAHDHVDGTSFSLAAYGEYLILDPGYVKDTNSKIFRVKTAVPQAHNLILINGEAAPTKEAFPRYGDTDAFLSNYIEGKMISYVEAYQDYQQSHIERSVAFIDKRYFIIADRISTQASAPREHRFRVGGYAGYGSNGIFNIRRDGATWERSLAGVDLYLSTTEENLEVVEPEFIKGEVPHVHKFDLSRETTEHGVIDGVVNSVSPYFLTILIPYRVNADGIDCRLTPERLQSPSNTVLWGVKYGENIDYIILRRPESPETFDIESGLFIDTDAELLILRYKGEKIAFALIARGTYLKANNKYLIQNGNLSGINLYEQE